MKYMFPAYRLFLVLVLLVLIGTQMDVLAQCPMCKTAAESNLKNGGSAGTGLNAGILYMLSMPYILLMTIGYLWYRHLKKKAAAV